jgi:hypothetical protein
MIIRRHTAGREKFKPRKFGDAPSLGNLPTVSGENPPLRKRRSSRTAQKKKLSKRFVGWSLLAFFVSVSLLTVSIVRNIRNKVLVNPSSNETEKLIDLDKAFDDSEKSDPPELKPAEAVTLVTQALDNRDPGLMQDFFVLGKDVNPAEAMEELVRIREAEGEITRTDWLAPKFPGERSALQAVVHTAKDEKEQSRRAQFALGSDGKWRIDLNAFLRKCEPPLAEVLSAESGTFLVRVFVSEETAYRGMYSDKNEWRAYSLTSPDIEDSLYAYAKRGSSQDKALRRILIEDELLHHATLRITKEPESGPRQFQVSQVIAGNWIVGETDFDGAF